MIRSYARHIIISGAAVSVSWILSFLMVLDVITPSFLLVIITYALAIMGLFVGFLVAFNIFQIKKKEGEQYSTGKENEEYSPFYMTNGSE